MTTESYIRQRGLYQGVQLELEAQLKPGLMKIGQAGVHD
jgi:hypothetical protein